MCAFGLLTDKCLSMCQYYKSFIKARKFYAIHKTIFMTRADYDDRPTTQRLKDLYKLTISHKTTLLLLITINITCLLQVILLYLILTIQQYYHIAIFFSMLLQNYFILFLMFRHKTSPRTTILLQIACSCQ